MAKAPKDPTAEPKAEAPTTPVKRVFVAPGHMNDAFLAKSGVLVQAAPNAFSGGLPIDLRRDGDKWVQFQAGIVKTDDPDIIAWCVDHPDICRDIADPQTEAWATLKEMSVETASKESSLPKGTDIDAILRGESQLGGPESLVARARRMT